VQISAQYTRDLKRTFRATTRLRRRLNRIVRAIGALFVLAAVLVGSTGGSTGTMVVLALCGVVIAVEPEVLLWLSLRRNREAIMVDVDVEVTDRGISSRTATGSVMAGWEMIKRVDETSDCWIFVVNRLQVATLYKSALTPDQRVEMSDFLAGRPWETLERPIQ
jgi:hypothetical protein